MEDVERRSVEIAPKWRDHFPRRDPPGWFDRTADGNRERLVRRTDDYIVEAFGWPTPALARTVTASGYPQPHSWPQEVLWIGMFTNIAAYTTVVLVLLFSVRLIRHRRRLARGACLSCGYDRRGLSATTVCPECGTL